MVSAGTHLRSVGSGNLIAPPGSDVFVEASSRGIRGGADQLLARRMDEHRAGTLQDVGTLSGDGRIEIGERFQHGQQVSFGVGNNLLRVVNGRSRTAVSVGVDPDGSAAADDVRFPDG